MASLVNCRGFRLPGLAPQSFERVLSALEPTVTLRLLRTTCNSTTTFSTASQTHVPKPSACGAAQLASGPSAISNTTRVWSPLGWRVPHANPPHALRHLRSLSRLSQKSRKMANSKVAESNINGSMPFQKTEMSINDVVTSLSPGEKLKQLRSLMKQNNVQVYIVYHADDHNSEITSAHYNRLEFISNFSGSAGTAVVTEDEALLWTDGRYFVQAGQQLDLKYWKLMKDRLPDTVPIPAFLIKFAKQNLGSRLGFDAWTTTTSEFLNYTKALGDLMPSVVMTSDLVAEVWGDKRPPKPRNTVFPHPLQFAGADPNEKMQRVRQKMTETELPIMLLTALDDIAWLLNLRGSDIPNSPLFIAYLIISHSSVTLYTDQERISETAIQHLAKYNVATKDYSDVAMDLSAMFPETDDLELKDSIKLWADPFVNLGIFHAVPNPTSNIRVRATPVALMKSVKNDVELKGMVDCHVEDGAAVCKFLHWLEEIAANGSLLAEDEFSVAKKVDGLRAKQDNFVSLSFDSASAIGPNGAIVHYHPPKVGSRKMERAMYLLDSGGQYYSGTTDITRTVHLGNPTAYEKDVWTRVLKGHIALARAVFPNGTAGPQLDAFARQYLWSGGFEYRHGTGHGVGSFMNVHEGPCGISPSLHGLPSETALVPGMVLSNEPGYYEEGKFGVRIESLVTVNKANIKSPMGIEFYKFDQLTVVPLQKLMMEVSIMSTEEIEWVNSYHALVWERVSAKLKGEELKKGVDNSKVLKWLEEAVKPIS